ncbi:MAG: Protein GrpE [Hyphomicrobiaceae bacterium hypho_1]
MSTETKFQDKEIDNMQPDEKTSEKSCIENQNGTVNSSAPEELEIGSNNTQAPKAYVDPSVVEEDMISEAEAQISELRDKYVRAVADNENLRKRTEREKLDISKYAITKFASDMLAIADNLRRAIDAASEAPDSEKESGPLKALLDGVQLTDQELQKSLEKNGIREILAKAEIFDPHKHQAVMEQDDPSVPVGTILKVLQDGYQIEDRVLRPSMVIVSKGGSKISKSRKTDNIDTITNSNNPSSETSNQQKMDRDGETRESDSMIDPEDKTEE